MGSGHVISIILHKMGSFLVGTSEPTSVCGLRVLLFSKQSGEEDGLRHTCREPTKLQRMNQKRLCRKALGAAWCQLHHTGYSSEEGGEERQGGVQI